MATFGTCTNMKTLGGPRNEADLMRKIDATRDDPVVRYAVREHTNVHYIEARSYEEAFLAYCQYLQRTKGINHSANMYLNRFSVDDYFVGGNVTPPDDVPFMIMSLGGIDEDAVLTAQGVSRPSRVIKACRAAVGAGAGAEEEEAEEDEEEE